MKTLYVSRPVQNGDELIAWAKSQGFTTTLPTDDMHVTLAFSRTPVDWEQFTPHTDEHVVAPSDTDRTVARLGEDGSAAVLKFQCPDLHDRWQQFRDGGASWDWPGYQPHVTISWQAPDGVEATAAPYTGRIVLGPEHFAEVKDDWKDNIVEKANSMPLGADADAKDWIDDFVNSGDKRFEDKSKEERIRMALGAYYSNKALNYAPSDKEVKAWLEHIEKRLDVEELKKARINEDLGLVMGYAVICKIDGQPYYDLNIDPDGQRVPEHITEEAMLKAAADFMLHSRSGNEMHEGPDAGTYVFAFPMTTDIAKALGVNTRVTGLLVAYQPPPEMLAKFKSGEYKGFSIQGRRISFEEHD